MKNWKTRGLATIAVLASSISIVRGDPPVPPTPPGGGPVTIWQKLGLGPAARAARRYRCCEKQSGELINNMTKPLGLLLGSPGGLYCPTLPSPAELAKPGAEGAAAQVKKDEAEAKARRAAVRFLGTVDCHYWPEAEKALILALRADRNECVRMEAALSLGNGCCCTKPTMEALAITVSGSDRDKNPSETSERVKAIAAGALQHCLSCYESVESVPEVAPPPPPLPRERPLERPAERLPEPPPVPGAQQSSYYDHLEKRSIEQVVSDGRRSMAKRMKPAPSSPVRPTGTHGLYDIFTAAWSAQAPSRPAVAISFTPVAADTTPIVPVMPPAPARQASSLMPERPVLTYAPVTSAPSKQIAPATSTPMKATTPAVSTPTIERPIITSAAPDARWHPTAASLAADSAPSVWEGAKPIRNDRKADDALSSRPPAVIQRVSSPTVPIVPSVVPALAPPTQAAPSLSLPALPIVPPTASSTALRQDHAATFASASCTSGRSPAALAVNPVTPAAWSESCQVIHPASAAVGAPAATSGTTLASVTEHSSSRLPKIINRQASERATQTAWQRPTTDQSRLTAATSAEVARLVSMLRRSEMPSNREFAAEALVTFPWWIHAEVLPALVTAALHDEAAVVRATCIRCLSRTDLRDPRVAEALSTLRSDSDLRVRTEAEAAVVQAAKVTAASRSLDAPNMGGAEMLPR
jgi:hypothetical protein